MENIKWTKLIDNKLELEVLTKRLPSKGNLVYEYNPFRNYRLSSNMYEFKNSIYSLGDLWNLFRISINCEAYRKLDNNVYMYKINPTEMPVGWYKVNNPEDFGKWIEEAYSKGHNLDKRNLEQALIESNISNAWYNVSKNETDPILREKGELVDFITDELSFNINNPVHIIPLYSYDGSVNLILNDGINIPRLINSRFSATGKNTYEIIDRKGNNDTNIYDLGELFDIDTSLYKRITKIPKINFKGLQAGGNTKIGNYHFYFKFSDADGNETDFVGESGLVSVFIGFNEYSAINTGDRDLNSFKQIQFQITNIDASYDYVTVYYTRNTAELFSNSVTEYVKIDKKYLVNNAEICNITITGYEDIIKISNSDINLNYNTVDSVVTSATCQNMLFLANVHKPNIPYEELSDLSLRFLPYLKLEVYDVDIDLNYSISTSNKGYIDPLYIYNKTGYWGKEIYRLGIVYILANGELSPVFNIRGGANIPEFNKDVYKEIPLYTKDSKTGNLVRNYIEYNEEKFTILENKAVLENIKGVVSFKPTKDTNTVYSIDIRVDKDTINELKKYVKGYFFVRQPRIPLVLSQGITIGIDKESHTPTIPTADGFLTELSDSLSKTHVTTEDINDVNFISEGFLKRYSFEIKKKSSSLFGKILKGVGIGIAVVVAAIATVYTAGAAGAVIGGAAAGIAGAASAGAAAVGTVAGTIAGTVGLSASLGVVGTLAVTAGVVGAAAGVGIATAGGILELRYGIASIFAKKKLDGRNTIAPPGYKLAELEDSRKLVLDFRDRFIPKDPSNNIVAGILCPDYEVDLPKFNLIFTGNEHLIELTNSLNINCLNGHSSNYFTNKDRHFYVPSYYDRNVNTCYYLKVVSVPDNVKCVGLEDLKFRSRAGEAEEAWRYECITDDYKSDYSKRNSQDDKETISNKKINTDIIRGSFGAYLGINDDLNRFLPAETVNIYIPGYSPTNFENYFYIRMTDNSVFNAITERYDIQDIKDYLVEPSNLVGEVNNSGYHFNAYRGDCYLCQFTHRINRNFNDPSSPYNDDIIDENSWKEHYDPDNTEEYANINLGDVNAILLGMWVTFRVRSSNNLNIRTLDGSNIDETAMCGHARGFYPYIPMSVEGNYKHPDSYIYNKGFTKSLSERWNFELPDVPHIKNWFGTRIMYSDIHINDAYKNGFRVFQGKNYRDYTREYGTIIKLISLESNLLCVFEHGVALIPVNERAVAGLSSGGNVYINTSNVLPENPKIISDMYGSQWAESVLKVPGKSGNAIQYVYGVDTIAKKIWRTDGNTLECISDFRVQEFLNNNISLGERELTPKIGIRNVKTVYNAYKRDVLFTFYDNTYGFEEKVWNLCWNELLLKFITFYSWVPSYMENINNIPFSFNRDTSKWIAKLGTSHSQNSFADGITLSNVIIENKLNSEQNFVENNVINIEYINKNGKLVNYNYKLSTLPKGYIGMLSLSNRVLPSSQLFYEIDYKLERDLLGNYKNFSIEPLTCNAEGGILLPSDAKFSGKVLHLYYLKCNCENIIPLCSEIYYRNKAGNSYSDYENNKIISTIENSIINNYPIYKNITGKRENLDKKDMINSDKIVTLLNIKANITILDENNETELSEDYYNLKAGYNHGTSLIDAGYYASTVSVIPRWNMQFLSTDFWKHGQSGLINIADDIFPTYWYGKQHPFEFECIIVDNPLTHKIFDNLEIISNKAKPESFHYEIIGESYDFAKDKPNMYFRQEAKKALWQYNGSDISYNNDFLKTLPKLNNKSADLPSVYYARQDTINEIYDSYVRGTLYENGLNKDYRNLSGSEIVYYKNRKEYRIWNHCLAVDVDSLDLNSGISIIRANCNYLEDRWRININPIIVVYKNEFKKGLSNSTWTSPNRPPLTIMNTPIPDDAKENIINNLDGNIEIPEVLTDLGYSANDLDLNDWLNNISGVAFNRKETDVRDKFMKVRIRYSGDELVVIDFLNTIYRISYA